MSHNNNVIFIGTSLGGYWAYYMANLFSVPFISINPAIEPSKTLANYDIPEQSIESYKNVWEFGKVVNSPGMILLDMGDDVISPMDTSNLLSGRYEVVTFDGGNHRFEHMVDALPYIQSFANGCDSLC